MPKYGIIYHQGTYIHLVWIYLLNIFTSEFILHIVGNIWNMVKSLYSLNMNISCYGGAIYSVNIILGECEYIQVNIFTFSKWILNPVGRTHTLHTDGRTLVKYSKCDDSSCSNRDEYRHASSLSNHCAWYVSGWMNPEGGAGRRWFCSGTAASM